MQETATAACLQLDTAGNGTGYGQYVNYYSSPWGITLSAALRHDYSGYGYNNAPPAFDGSRLLGPTLHTLQYAPTRPCAP